MFIDEVVERLKKGDLQISFRPYKSSDRELKLLQKVLKLAFPRDRKVQGSCNFYYRNSETTWLSGSSPMNIPCIAIENIIETEMKLKEEDKIIGYKWKKGKEEYALAADALIKKDCRGWSFLIHAPSVFIMHGFHFGEGFGLESVANTLRKADVLDKWFEPVYEAKVKFPKIKGKDGKIYAGAKIYEGVVTYGCAEISIPMLKNIINSKMASGNRWIKQIELSSGVILTSVQIEEIVKAYEAS